VNEDELQARYDELRRIVQGLGSVVVGFSGGVDSTLLLKVGADVLGPQNVLAATARSPSFPTRELEGAREIAQSLSVRHEVFDTDELSDPHFARNPPDRCYFCKRELLAKLIEIAGRERMAAVAEASNLDDWQNDYRPGLRAVRELGVRSPLREARLRKQEVRELSRRLGLPTHDKPSFACLASRFPYGEHITRQKLERVGKAEEVLREMGFRQFRVRSHDNLARIELGAGEDLAALMEPQSRAFLVSRLRELGYLYVALDLQGYRTGSMNEALSIQ